MTANLQDNITEKTKNASKRTLIDLRQVVKTYDTPAGPFTALKNIDLQVNAGEFVAVIGKSGSGKSTLINMITGIDRPTLGEVIIGGNPIHDLNEDQIAIWRGLNLGVIFQFFQLLPTLTVLENVMLPMELRQTYPQSERKERAFHLLEQVELVDQANKFPSAISGGQQQRVAIARALSNDPDVIVGDEPTGSLDSKTADSIFQIFEEFVSQGKTILLVTHDRELAGRIPRVVFIADGEITDQFVASALPQLASEELAQVSSKLEPIKFRAGETIIKQGDPADHFYILVKGQVDIILQHASGAKVMIGQLSAGQYFGEIGLLENKPRSATVKATSDSDVIVMQLDSDSFTDVITRSEMTHEDILHSMRRRVMQQYLSQILPGLSTSQLDDILLAVEITEYQPETMIVARDTTAKALSIIIEGQVDAIDGQDQVVDQLKQGQSFGDLQSLQDGKYVASYRASAVSKVMTVDFGLIEQISADLTPEEISQTLRRRYLEITLGEFVPGLQRRKRDINLDFLNDSEPTQN